MRSEVSQYQVALVAQYLEVRFGARGELCFLAQGGFGVEGTLCRIEGNEAYRCFWARVYLEDLLIQSMYYPQ